MFFVFQILAFFAGKFKFKNAISLEWIGIFQFFFTFDILVVTSFRNHHYISHNTKTKFGGNSVTSFSRQKCQNLKNENVRFFGVVISILLQNFK